MPITKEGLVYLCDAKDVVEVILYVGQRGEPLVQ